MDNWAKHTPQPPLVAQDAEECPPPVLHMGMGILNTMSFEMAHEIIWGVPCGPTLGIMWQHWVQRELGLYLHPHQARMIEVAMSPKFKEFRIYNKYGMRRRKPPGAMFAV